MNWDGTSAHSLCKCMVEGKTNFSLQISGWEPWKMSGSCCLYIRGIRPGWIRPEGPTGPVTDSEPLSSNYEQRCKKQKVEKHKLKYPKGQRCSSAVQSLAAQTWWPQSHPLIPCEKLDVAVHIWFPCTPTRGWWAWARNITSNSWGLLTCRSPTRR